MTTVEKTYAEIERLRREFDATILKMEAPYRERIAAFSKLFHADSQVEVTGFSNGDPNHYLWPW